MVERSHPTSTPDCDYPNWTFEGPWALTRINERPIYVRLDYTKTFRQAEYTVYWKQQGEWQPLFRQEIGVGDEHVADLELYWQEFTRSLPEMIMEHLL